MLRAMRDGRGVVKRAPGNATTGAAPRVKAIFTVVVEGRASALSGGTRPLVTSGVYMAAISYSVLPRIIMPLAAGLLCLSLMRTAPMAAEARVVTIPANDGYGITDCLAAAQACGRVIADAWCEAHGYGRSLAYGRADDVTGAILASTTRASIEPGAYLVSCGE